MSEINMEGLNQFIIDLKETVQEARTQADRLEELISKVEKIELDVEATKKVSNQLVKASDLSEETMNELVNAYPAWEVGLAVKVGEMYAYNNKLYEVIQGHTTQGDWTPDTVPALFKAVTPATTNEGGEIVPDWVAPTDAHDAYKIGDKVLFEGKVYKSLIDANTWSPTAYPQGWELVE